MFTKIIYVWNNFIWALNIIMYHPKHTFALHVLLKRDLHKDVTIRMLVALDIMNGSFTVESLKHSIEDKI